MLSRRECFLVLLPASSYTDARDSTMKPLAPSPIAYNNHYGAHLPASPAHDILMITSPLPHLHPHQPAMMKVLVPPANAISTHTRKPSRVIDIRRWARANTPPGYWNIGFPDTQEVGDINERAEEMHNKKREVVEREVGGGGGKYRRR